MSVTGYVAPLQTTVNHENLRAEIAKAWRKIINEEPTSEGVAIVLAQSAHETGRWAHCWNWNLGGIKSNGKGMHTFLATLERMPRARGLSTIAASSPSKPCELAEDKDESTIVVRFRPNHPTCCFRAYPSLSMSVTGYVALLAGRYRKALLQAKTGNVEGFVHELRARGYFTAKESEYISSVSARYDEYRDICLATMEEISSSLTKLGFYPGTNFKLAVKKFQKESNLVSDGIVGAKTRASIRQALTKF